MKNTLGAILLAGALAPGCNSKSPEQTETSGQSQPKETPQPAVEAAVVEEAPAEPPRDPASIEGPTHVAYDLLHNRPLAHTKQSTSDGRGSLVAHLDSPSGNRYTAGNHGREWKLETVDDDRKVLALRKTRTGTLWLPSTTTDAGVFEAEVFNPATQPNDMTLTFNGQKLPAVSVEPGWQTLKIDVPAAAMRFENEVGVEFKSMGRVGGNLSGGGFGTVRLGGTVTTALAEATDVARAQDALMVNPTLGGASWTLWALPNARVSIDARTAENCAVEAVWWKEQGGELVEAGRKPVAAGTTWVDLGVQKDLVRFDLSPTGETCPEGVDVQRAQLVLPGEAPKVPEVAAPKLVLFWMIDTLRADHLPIHFETNVQAPNLVKLAAEGASFKVAYVQGNESRSSHASLFSGMYPNKHRVLARGHLKPHHHLFSEAFQDADYKTYAFISNGYVSEPWGFVQGWDMYRNNLREGYGIDGMAMKKHAIDWVEKHKDEKFLLYVGTIDPHVTYRMHEEFIGLYDDPDYRGRFRNSLLGTTLGEIAGKKVTLDEREQERVKALYKNEITYNDKAFGELRKDLEALGLWEQTMVVVTGDHGDQFWEHGGVGHGSGVHQEVVHVPLIVYYPPLIPAGTQVEAGADVLDIYPTLMDAIGNDKSYEGLQGHSLLPLIHKVRGDYPEPAIATHYTSRYGIQMQQWKLIVKKGSYELFDRKSDPLELSDVKGKHPLAERWMHDTFGVFRPHRDSWSKAKFGPPSNLAGDYLAQIEKLKEDETD